MNINKEKILLIVLFITLLIAPIVIIFLSRNLFSANYVFSSIYKIIFLFPLVFGFFIEKKSIRKALFENFSFKTFRKNLFFSLLIGICLAGIYISGFLVFRNLIDTQIIAVKLTELISINLSNLIFIGVYIILANSLLEEYFWRGFMFKRLNDLINPKLAYIITGLAFSFHHIMFYYNWFSLPVFIAVTLGLTVYSMIMNLIFQKYNDLFSCWLVHGIADVAQIFIAFKVFNLI